MVHEKPANGAPVLVIDLQAGMFDGLVEPPVHDADRLTEHARKVIDWARREGRKIAFIRHDGPEGDPLAPGEPGWPVSPALGQAEDEPTFSKKVGDAFSNPELGKWIEAQDAPEVVLLGAQTDFCVAATVKGAMSNGLKVTVVSDAHSTLDQPDETAPAIINRYNAQFAEAGVNLVTTEALTGSQGS
ncbi:isochorismatase family protein [Neorhizobium petrolearium]|uniref:Isochorismatase family protein n=1 Tax=Neorhizobium petrolearium TaxID=515361 RepID=A0ABY8MBK3_9HYPH|nr:isochorismatase family protein [Neorhizobium petrolearium]MCC2613527.1 isochorismatase family protein [Neorhizobium petrolearium]WGI71847.1 isochorismatase family protein [Neorhizobium petrolearium]